MPLPDAAFLGHMLSAVDRLSGLVAKTDRASFDRDWVIQDAVIRELEILGEAAGRLSAEFRDAHPEIPWREITGMRHKLIHDYFVVDLGICPGARPRSTCLRLSRSLELPPPS